MTGVQTCALPILTTTGYIEMLFTPPGGGSTDQIFDPASYPTVNLSTAISPHPSGYQYAALTIYFQYDDPAYSTSGLGTIGEANQTATFYAKNTSTNAVYNLGSWYLDIWDRPSLSIRATNATNALDLYNITGAGTFSFYLTTNLLGTVYTYQHPQQLVL